MKLVVGLESEPGTGSISLNLSTTKTLKQGLFTARNDGQYPIG